MRWLIGLALLAAALPTLHAQAPAPPAALPAAVTKVEGDLKKMQGFWKCASILHEGKEQLDDPKQRAALTLVVKEAEYRMYCVSDSAKDEHIRLFTADLRLDAATKTFEMTVVGGREKGKKVHGIYELDKGQWKTCYGPAEKARPAKFEAAKDSGYFCETWTPEKK